MRLETMPSCLGIFPGRILLPLRRRICVFWLSLFDSLFEHRASSSLYIYLLLSWRTAGSLHIIGSFFSPIFYCFVFVFEQIFDEGRDGESL